MFRRTLCVFLCLVLCFCWAAAVSAAEAPVTVAAPSYILMDAATGTVLLEHNSHEQLPPASVTKVMTLLLIMQALEEGRIGWDDTVTASTAASQKGGSQVYLKEGEQMPLRDMLKSVVVASANDCATALAEHVAGSEAAFVQMMNDKAQELGLQDTLFANCTGLDDEAGAELHHTSAHDLAVMSRALLQYDGIRDYTTIWMDTVRNGEFGLSNTNKLVRFYKGTTGLKTGYTSAAGHCLSASAQRDGLELIAVVLHCASSADRFESAKALMDYGFANYTLVSVLPEESIGSVPVHLGQTNAITPVPASEEALLLSKSQASGLQKQLRVDESVNAPVQAGQQLGTLTLSSGGEVLAEIPLVAPEAVARLSYWQILFRVLRAVCLSGHEETM